MKLPKAFMPILVVVGVLNSGVVNAEVKLPINQVDSLLYDGTTLKVAYRTGGGCETHEPRFHISLRRDQHTATAKVNVYDVTPKEDLCEAMLGVSGSINLKKALEEKLKKTDLDLWEVTVELPKVAVTPMDED